MVLSILIKFLACCCLWFFGHGKDSALKKCTKLDAQLEFCIAYGQKIIK